MNPNYQFRDDVRHFLKRLRNRCGSKPDDRPPDPGGRAALRRGASETTRHLAWPVIRQCGGDIRHPAWTAVGAAFAFYPQPEAKPDSRFSFGSTCFVLAEPTRDNGRSSFDARFRRVLGADSAEDLAKWVVQIAKRAKTAKPRPASLNYEELLTALLHWDARDGALREGVRRRWATAYWQPETSADEESAEL